MQLLNKDDRLNVYNYFYCLLSPKKIYIKKKNNFIQYKTWIEKWEKEQNNKFLETGNNCFGRPTGTHS